MQGLTGSIFQATACHTLACTSRFPTTGLVRLSEANFLQYRLSQQGIWTCRTRHRQHMYELQTSLAQVSTCVSSSNLTRAKPSQVNRRQVGNVRDRRRLESGLSQRMAKIRSQLCLPSFLFVFIFGKLLFTFPYPDNIPFKLPTHPLRDAYLFHPLIWWQCCWCWKYW